MHTVNITGQAADLKWGYHSAGRLGAWSVATVSPGTFTFSATIVSKDDFRLSQRPLEVVTPNGWRWIVDPDTLQITDGTLTASIRPKE